MKFTTKPATLEKMLKGAGGIRPRQSELVTLSAAGGRIFLEYREMTIFTAAAVASEGGIVLLAHTFKILLDTYKRTPVLTFEAGPDGLTINQFKMPIIRWIANPPRFS